jgi:hypothetical protein
MKLKSEARSTYNNQKNEQDNDKCESTTEASNSYRSYRSYRVTIASTWIPATVTVHKDTPFLPSIKAN